ncbi:MAG: manganese efflux pump, partial [Eubacteriales bacterium]
MIKESFEKEEKKEEEKENPSSPLAFKTMLTMAIATSIDALAVGISFGILPDVNITVAVSSIGIITFILSAVGVKIGNVFGAKYKSKAEFAGGLILVLLGIKILLEHLGVL